MDTFDFQRDTFDFVNDVNLPCEHGGTVVKRRLRRCCEGMTRAWHKFWYGARFISGERLPLEEEKLRTLKILQKPVYLPALPENARVVLPGYEGLRAFSRIHVSWLPWRFDSLLRTHFRLGVQRMAYPFTRRGQQLQASSLSERLRAGRISVVHASRFPVISINHFVICFSASEMNDKIEFQAYDPNRPTAPITLHFDKTSRHFHYPKTMYFLGGPVNVSIAYGSRLW